MALHGVQTQDFLIPRFGIETARKFDEPDSPGGGTRPTGIPIAVARCPHRASHAFSVGSGSQRLPERVFPKKTRLESHLENLMAWDGGDLRDPDQAPREG